MKPSCLFRFIIILLILKSHPGNCEDDKTVADTFSFENEHSSTSNSKNDDELIDTSHKVPSSTEFNSNSNSNNNNFGFKKHSKDENNNDNYDGDYASDASISSDEYNVANTNKNDPEGLNVNIISPKDKQHDCGTRDKCPENATTIQNVLFSPEICRCDVDECLKYGDCCWSIIENRTLSEKKNLWKCQRLEVQTTSTIHALMISECPDSSRDKITKQLCSGQNIPLENHTYSVDLPVYINKTNGQGILYKNIYCARCHDEKNSHIKQWTLQLACNHEFTPTERSDFMSTARYIPGERMWQNDNGSSRCALKIAELKENEVEANIPNIRYCPSRGIDYCPSSNPLQNENYNFDKINKLCSSYAQYVMNTETGTIYKNPHCALCYESNKTSIPITCRKPNIGTTFFRVRPGETGAILPGAGLNFLFDFGLSDNKYVGYEMLCGEDEIWDYIRQKCSPMLCGKGYTLKNGHCVKNPASITPTNPNKNTTNGGSGGNTGSISDGNNNGDKDDDSNDNENGDLDNNDESKNGDVESEHLHDDDEYDPECTQYRLLLHEHEYKLLSVPNNSISIHLGNHSIILSASQYEFVNETTISICAKYLHHAFRATFSPTLNYLSLISVGLSVIFSSFHIILYVLLPKLRNSPGRNLFCLTSSLFIFQLLFITLFTHDESNHVCVGAAIIMHYFSLAAFFWMNIMSFDMWRTFSCNTLLRRSHSTDGQKFIKYSAFAWCTPAIIVTIAIVFDFGFPASNYENIDDDVLATVRPSYGENGLCWITQRLSLFIFFALPVAFVITTNMIFFSFTAKAILSQQKESSRMFKNGNKSPTKIPTINLESKYNSATNSISTNTTTITDSGVKNKQVTTPNKSSSSSSPSKATHATNRDKIRLMLYVNMALIMGLGWILGFVSQFLASDWLRYPFVIINGLQGTFIFFAFDFKWKIYKMLKEKIYSGRLGKMFGLTRSTSSVGVDGVVNNRRGTISNSGTRSTNIVSNSEDEKGRRISSVT